MPYSDPLADGPTIRKVIPVALRGISIKKKLFEQLAAVRDLLLTANYTNGLFSWCCDVWFRKVGEASRLGVDKLILPDMPLQNTSEYKPLFDQYHLVLFFSLPQTSEERIHRRAR